MLNTTSTDAETIIFSAKIHPDHLHPDEKVRDARRRKEQIDRYRKDVQFEIQYRKKKDLEGIEAQRKAVEDYSNTHRLQIANKFAKPEINSFETFVAAMPAERGVALNVFSDALNDIPANLDYGPVAKFFYKVEGNKAIFNQLWQSIRDSAQEERSEAINQYLQKVAALKRDGGYSSPEDLQKKLQHLDIELNAKLNQINRQSKSKFDYLSEKNWDDFFYDASEKMIKGPFSEAYRPLLQEMEKQKTEFEEEFKEKFANLMDEDNEALKPFTKLVKTLQFALLTPNEPGTVSAVIKKFKGIYPQVSSELSSIETLYKNGETNEAQKELSNLVKALEKNHESENTRNHAASLKNTVEDMGSEILKPIPEKAEQLKQKEIEKLENLFYQELQKRKPQIEALFKSHPEDLAIQLQTIYEESAKAAFAQAKTLGEEHWKTLEKQAQQEVEKLLQDNKKFERDHYMRTRFPEKKDKAGQEEGVVLSTGAPEGERVTPLRDLEPGKVYDLENGSKIVRDADGVISMTASFPKMPPSKVPAALLLTGLVTVGLRAGYEKIRESHNERKTNRIIDGFVQNTEMLAACAEGPVMVACTDPKIEASLREYYEVKGVPVIKFHDSLSFDKKMQQHFHGRKTPVERKAGGTEERKEAKRPLELREDSYHKARLNSSRREHTEEQTEKMKAEERKKVEETKKTRLGIFGRSL